MLLIVGYLVIVGEVHTLKAEQQTFKAVRWPIDLRKPPDEKVVRTQNVQIYAEPNSPVCYWAPKQQREVAEVVYRFDSEFEIAEVRLSGIGVDAWNRHADVCFDQEATAVLECSFDGKNWQEIARHMPDRGVKRPPETLRAPHAARSFWLRARLYETSSWNANRIHYSQFMRSEPSQGSLPVVEILGLMETQREQAENTTLAHLQLPVGAAPDRGGLKSFVNSVGIRMVELPAGTFAIGSGQLAMEAGLDPGAAGIRTQSGFGKPVHAVTITRDFAIGEHEVTQGQWEKVVGTRPWEGRNSVVSDPERPAVFVSWADAVAFCDKLTAAERAAQMLPAHRYYSLPTEAEWEYACRAGRATLWHNGDDETRVEAVAWYGVDYLRSTFEPDVTAEAGAQQRGRKQPNGWGLFDMHGNVSEWCVDWYGPYASGEETDPRGPEKGLNRVVRGGSWADDGKRVSAAWRGSHSPGMKNEFVGFRLALMKTPMRLGVALEASPQREMGLEILEVTEGSVAEQAGLAKGDLILTANGLAMNDLRALALLLGQASPGDSIRLTVRRGENEVVKDVLFESSAEQ